MHTPTRKISVAQLPSLLPTDWAQASTLAIVIDTLRFTSTCCQALVSGAKDIRAAAELDAARQLAQSIGSLVMLCGERHCNRIEGFDLGNSPLEYQSHVVGGRSLVFSTTNGTRAVQAAQAAEQVIMCGLVNRGAVANYVQQSGFDHVWIVCAGTDGQIAAEDVLTAGAVVQSLLVLDRHARLANDSALMAANLMAQLVAAHRPSTLLDGLQQYLSQTLGGRNLIESGYRSDLLEVARLDALDVVPGNSPSRPELFTSLPKKLRSSDAVTDRM